MNDDAKLPVSAKLDASAKVNVDVKTEIPSDASGRALHAILDVFSPFTESMGLWGEHIRFYRQEVIIKIARRAKEIADQEGVELNPVPPKFLVPFIEKASCEDLESELIDMWANLLKGASKNYRSELPVYADILSQLGVDQALVLLEMYKRTDHEDLGRGYSEAELQEMELKLFGGGMKFIETPLGLFDGHGRYFAILRSGKDYERDALHYIEYFNASETISLLERQCLVEASSLRSCGLPILEHQIAEATWAKLVTLGHRFLAACGVD